MIFRTRRNKSLKLPVLCAWAVAASAFACSVPVFRYALEHWSADPYDAYVFHRGPWLEHQKRIFDKLKKNDAGIARPGIAVHDVDLSQSPAPEVLDLWKQAGSPEAPWLVLKPPHAPLETRPVASAALSEAAVASIFDSTARREITRRLGEGESAVWIFLESGDKAQDDAAANLLETRLNYLGSVLALPKLDEQDIRNGLVSVPADGLRLAFSVLRVSRHDAAERVFIPMLLATEKDLADQRAPIVFPVFGQARVLYALVGGGIRHETIDRAASFLIGSCSCQVKEQNPGSDLLVSADWTELLKAQSLGVRDLPKVSDIVGAMPVTVTISPPADEDRNTRTGFRDFVDWTGAHRGIAASAAAFVFLTAGFLAMRVFRKRAA